MAILSDGKTYENIKVLKFSEFSDEIKINIDLLVIGVSSKGIEWIGNEISKFYKPSIDILLLTKGLAVINDKFETFSPNSEFILVLLKFLLILKTKKLILNILT